MNNSKLVIDSINLSGFEETPPIVNYREREERLKKIIKALEDIASTGAWSSLKEHIFDDLTSTLEKQLKEEAKKEDPDALKLNRLAGQLKWAEKFSDLEKLANVFRVELTGIKKKLHGTS